MKTPDPNAKAPRPSHVSADQPRTPDMDHPPPSRGAERAAFDRGTAAADRDARSGQRPGQGDYAAVQAEGTADTPDVERAKHEAQADSADADRSTSHGGSSTHRE